MAKVEIKQQNGYNFLWIDNELWMWDVPQEVNDQKKIAEEARGDVLVAGYGLGVVQKFLTKNEKVDSVLSIERLECVVEKCKKVFGVTYGGIEICDFYDYSRKNKFDCVIGDLWLDKEEEYLEEYVRFKKKAKTLIKDGGRILGWGMDYMEYLLDKRQHL